MPHLMLYEMPSFITEHKDLIIAMIIGAVAGYIAQAIVPGGRGFGLLATILIGMIGGWIGEKLIGSYLHIFNDEIFNEILCATIGALVLVIILNIAMGKPKEGKDEKDIYDWGNE